MSETLKITLDTNAFIYAVEHPKNHSELFETIMKHDTVVTTRTFADIQHDKNTERKEEMTQLLESLPTIGSVFRFNVSRWNSGDFFTSEKDKCLEKELRQILFPTRNPGDELNENDRNDLDILVAHCSAGRDIFITNDNKILSKSDELREKMEIEILSPSQLKQLQ